MQDLIMDFDVQVVNSVEEIGQEAWDHLSAGRPFASYRWYRFGEAVMANDTPVYIILSSKGEPVARATFWIRRGIEDEFETRISRFLTRAFFSHWPLLDCASPLSATPGLTLSDLSLRDAAIETIVQVAQDQARRHQVSFLLLGYFGPPYTEWNGWRSSTFESMDFSDPGTRLVITWPDFESYLNHLPRKKRKHYRQRVRHGAEMGIEITQHQAVTNVDEAMRLIQNVAKHYHELPPLTARRTLENSAMVDAIWLEARIEEQLVGCELMLGDGGTWRVVLMGRDYNFDYVYFLLSYTDIRCAIERGAKILRWGSESYEVKRRLGFELEGNTKLLFAGRGAVFRRLGRWAAKIGPDWW